MQMKGVTRAILSATGLTTVLVSAALQVARKNCAVYQHLYIDMTFSFL